MDTTFLIKHPNIANKRKLSSIVQGQYLSGDQECCQRHTEPRSSKTVCISHARELRQIQDSRGNISINFNIKVNTNTI